MCIFHHILKIFSYRVRVLWQCICKVLRHRCDKVACLKRSILNTDTDPLVVNSVKLITELVKLVQIKKFYSYIRDSSYISLVAYLLVII
jgi:hypothetical protein